MNAQRKVALVPIVAGLQEDVSQYPLSSAIVDLQTYYEAGTMTGALQAILADAGTKDAEATKLIDQYRTTAYGPGGSSALTHSGDSQVPRAMRFWRHGSDSMRDCERFGSTAIGGACWGSAAAAEARGEGADRSGVCRVPAGTADRRGGRGQPTDGLALAAALCRGRRGRAAA
jgi:hypothetical protein